MYGSKHLEFVPCIILQVKAVVADGRLKYSSGSWAARAKDELNSILNVCIEKYIFSILIDDRSFCFMALMVSCSQDEDNNKQILEKHRSENYFRVQ